MRNSTKEIETSKQAPVSNWKLLGRKLAVSRGPLV
jgi:hypothetical protein